MFQSTQDKVNTIQAFNIRKSQIRIYKNPSYEAQNQNDYS